MPTRNAPPRLNEAPALWGQPVPVPLVADPVPVSCDGDEVPTTYDQLPKKCKRLIEVAVHKRVDAKLDDSHFSALVRWGFLTSEGKLTEAGRRLRDT